MGAYVGHEPGQTIRSAFRFVALDGQTVFQGRDASGNVLNYTKGAATIVAVNGAILSPNAYTANDGSTLVLAAGVTAGRDVLVLVDAPWSPADTYTKGAADALFTRRRNRFTDPGLRISQQNGNNALTLAGVQYPTDSIQANRAGGGTATVQRVYVQTPSGSACRVRLTVTAALAPPAATDFTVLSSQIEGVDIADLAFGTGQARPVGIRFGCRSSVAGTFTVALRNGVYNRAWLGTFTISPAEVGTDVVRYLVAPGDVTGAWSADASLGMNVSICLNSGSNFYGGAGWQAGNLISLASATNLMAVNGATFDLFDIGLYDASGIDASIIPRFELGSYEQDLAKCLRYYTVLITNARNYAQVVGQNFDAHIAFPVIMRNAPTASLVSAGGRSNIASNNSPIVVPTGAQSARFNIVAAATGDFYALAETWALNSRM